MSGKTSNSEASAPDDVQETQLGCLTDEIRHHSVSINAIHRRLEGLKVRLVGEEPCDQVNEPEKEPHPNGLIETLHQSHQDTGRALEAVSKTLGRLEQIV